MGRVVGTTTFLRETSKWDAHASVINILVQRKAVPERTSKVAATLVSVNQA